MRRECVAVQQPVVHQSVAGGAVVMVGIAHLERDGDLQRVPWNWLLMVLLIEKSICLVCAERVPQAPFRTPSMVR